MYGNSELDFDSAERFVLREIRKNIDNHEKNKKNSKSPKEKVEHEDFYLLHSVLASYTKRQNFFTRKLNPEMTEQEIINSGYELLFIRLYDIADPNYKLKTAISVDFTFAGMVEDHYNKKIKEKFGDDAEEEIFGETFMKTFEEVV